MGMPRMVLRLLLSLVPVVGSSMVVGRDVPRLVGEGLGKGFWAATGESRLGS